MVHNYYDHCKKRESLKILLFKSGCNCLTEQVEFLNLSGGRVGENPGNEVDFNLIFDKQKDRSPGCQKGLMIGGQGGRVVRASDLRS